MSRFLLPDEVATLTGYKRKADQRRHLMKEGIPFRVDRFGKPIVMWESVSGTVARTADIPEGMPDLKALEELERGTQTTH